MAVVCKIVKMSGIRASLSLDFLVVCVSQRKRHRRNLNLLMLMIRPKISIASSCVTQSSFKLCLFALYAPAK